MNNLVAGLPKAMRSTALGVSFTGFHCGIAFCAAVFQEVPMQHPKTISLSVSIATLQATLLVWQFHH
jgi:hypothetical protein